MSKKTKSQNNTVQNKSKVEKTKVKKNKIELIIERWPEQRKMGRNKYILKFGVINWGVTTFAIYWIMMTATSYLMDQPQLSTPFQLFISLIFFIIFGITTSTATWYRNERMYNEKFPYKK